jgi:hypothetical protein
MKTTTNKIRQFADKTLPALCIALLLTACGGGGGTTGGSGGTTGGNNGGGPVTPVAVAQESRSRISDGFSVQVTPYALNTASVPERFDVSVTDPSKVTGLVASVGKSFDAGTSITTSVTSSGWTINVPAGTSKDSFLLLKFTLANGDAFETGVTDFPF